MLGDGLGCNEPCEAALVSTVLWEARLESFLELLLLLLLLLGRHILWSLMRMAKQIMNPQEKKCAQGNRRENLEEVSDQGATVGVATSEFSWMLCTRKDVDAKTPAEMLGLEGFPTKQAFMFAISCPLSLLSSLNPKEDIGYVRTPLIWPASSVVSNTSLCCSLPMGFTSMAKVSYWFVSTEGVFVAAGP